jgi:hypothetical protein
MGQNPYTHLKEVAHKFAIAVRDRHTREAFHYKEVNNLSNISIFNVKASVEAAERLGYLTEVYSEDGGLCFRYVKKLPSIPWEIS